MDENPEKVRSARREWQAANKDRVKIYAQRRRPKAAAARRERTVARYGLGIGEYEKLREAQGGCCAICKNPERGKALAVDHCHETGAVRGLLCQNCNNGLGRFRDDPAMLDAAALYLRAFRQIPASP